MTVVIVVDLAALRHGPGQALLVLMIGVGVAWLCYQQARSRLRHSHHADHRPDDRGPDGAG